ncbi:MAG TPA: VWA domain-containing protein, partial [Candidatus Polarisedimenticolia bacterium]|nr:VWA domain-containing protein [Candidatus Polarisedimenticolia bacterium]
FFEDSTSSPVQMTNARRAAIQFLEKPALPTDLFGIASYSEKRKLEILQEFTSDRAHVRQVLEKSVEDRVRYSDFGPERIERMEEIRRLLSPNNTDTTASAQAAQLARTYATEDSSRMGRVLNIMKVLVDGLAAYEGYKSIVFIGEGVPQNPGTDYNLNDPRLEISSEMSGLAFAAGGANVTLHSIQVDGLAAGNATTVGASSRRSSVLQTLALDTGGVSLTTNDVTAAFGTVERSSAGYYLMTYAPQDLPDGNYHSVALKCARRGVTIRYRRGFVRYRPEEARMRAIQAAYVAPELHREMGVDLAAVAGPRAGKERVYDLVLYVPPKRLLFLPQAGGPAARVEVGIVAYDAGGGETLRLARRVRVAPEAAGLANAAASGFDFFTRVRLPERAQTITAVISDLQSGDLGSARVAVEPPGATAGTAQGLSLYATREKSLWVEISEPGGKPAAAGPELDAGVTAGPALRTRFAPGETIACGFKPGGAGTDAAAEMRLVVRRGEEVVRTFAFAPLSATGTGGGTLHADLPTGGLADGDYVASVETTQAGATTEIGRMPFRIGPIGAS